MPTKKKTAPVLVTVVLDRSGSMDSCKAETIEAFNGYLLDLQKDKDNGEAFITLRQFDTYHDLLFRAIKVEDAPFLDDAVYQPRGSTALNDAIGLALADLDEADVPEETKHLLVVITDGFENASTEHTVETIKALLEEREKAGRLTVTFLQGNLSLQSAQKVAGAYGVSPGNVAAYASMTPGSTHSVVGTTSRATAKLRGSAVGQTISFYGDAGEEQDNSAPVWDEKTKTWRAAEAKSS